MSDDELLRHLADLSFLKPEHSDLSAPDLSAQDLNWPDGTAPGRMPDDVARRLDAVIAAAAAERTATAAAPSAVTALPGRRGTRWATGLIAASVAVVAAGVITTSLNRSEQPVVVADAPLAASTAAVPVGTSAKERSTPQAATVPEPEALNEVAAAGPAIDTSQLETAGLIPTMRVQSSQTNYTHEALNSQVSGLLASAGVSDPAQVETMEPLPVQWPVDNGFTTSASALADCLSWLMPPGTSAVVVVDRGSFEGSSAGVIVANSPAGMQVWVIDPQCPHEQAGVMDHQPYQWQE